MPLGALDQQVHHARAGAGHPIDRRASVAVAEDFDAREQAVPGRPLGDALSGLALALGDARRGDLDPVDLHLGEQQARELELLGGRVRDVGRLLAVAQGRVHDLDAGILRGGHGGNLTLPAMEESSGELLEVLPSESGRRLDVFLAERLSLSRSGVRRLLASGAVRVGGRIAAEGDKGLALSAGERVEVAAQARAEADRIPHEPEAPLCVLAQGPGWLVADKSAGVPVHPLAAGERGTLLGAVAARHPEIQGIGEGGLRSGVVHRLDVDTSGALVIATDTAQWRRLRAAFREHRVEKRYRAIA